MRAPLPRVLPSLFLLLPACRPTPATTPATAVPDRPTAAVAEPEPEAPPIEPPIDPATPTSRCGALAPVVDRHEGDLTVPANPQSGERGPWHVGSWRFGEPRTWVGPPVPAAIPLYVGHAELVELRSVGQERLAIYDTPPGAPGCTDWQAQSCPQMLRLFDECGALLWSVDPLAYFAKGKTARGVDNVLYQDGVLYFDEACTIASTPPKGRCGALVAVDPVAGKQLWRTAAMTSSGPLLIHQGWLVTVYQYLGQKAHVHLLRPATGSVGLRMKVEAGLWDLAVAVDGHLQLAAFGENHMHYTMSDWDTDHPKLARVPGYRD